MNKKTVLMLIGGTVIVLFIGWFYINQLASPKLFYKEKTDEITTQINDQQTNKEKQNVLSKTNSQGSVDMEVILIPEKSNSDFLLFEVALNTHTGDLLQYKLDDLAQISFGNTINKTGVFEWEIDNEDSHHTVGFLRWRGEVKSNSSIELELKNIDKAASRSFTWDKNEVASSIAMEN